jgi:hypothetical protein
VKKKFDNRTFFPIVLIMDNKTYHVSGLFETGTENATFPRTREGLDGAYDFVSNAAAYVIKCGDELVEEVDPWAEFEPSAADLAQAERDERQAGAYALCRLSLIESFFKFFLDFSPF